MVFAACLVGVAVSLVVTVQWAPIAGWLFVFFVLASLGANTLRAIQRRRWEADAVPVRLAGRTRVVRAIVFVATGTGTALLVHELVGKPIVAWFAFLAGGTIGTWIFAAIVLGRFAAKLGSPRDAKGPELGLDFTLGLASASLEQTATGSPGWANVVARCVASAYDAGLEAGRAADPRRATHLTLRRENLHGRPEPVQAAWADVIDAARRGIAAGEAERSAPRGRTP